MRHKMVGAGKKRGPWNGGNRRGRVLRRERGIPRGAGPVGVRGAAGRAAERWQDIDTGIGPGVPPMKGLWCGTVKTESGGGCGVILVSPSLRRFRYDLSSHPYLSLKLCLLNSLGILCRAVIFFPGTNSSNLSSFLQRCQSPFNEPTSGVTFLYWR